MQKIKFLFIIFAGLVLIAACTSRAQKLKVYSFPFATDEMNTYSPLIRLFPDDSFYSLKKNAKSIKIYKYENGTANILQAATYNSDGTLHTFSMYGNDSNFVSEYFYKDGLINQILSTDYVPTTNLSKTTVENFKYEGWFNPYCVVYDEKGKLSEAYKITNKNSVITILKSSRTDGKIVWDHVYSYQYDTNGNLIQLRDKWIDTDDKAELTYTLGHISSLKYFYGKESRARLVVQYEYAPDGRLVSLSSQDEDGKKGSIKVVAYTNQGDWTQFESNKKYFYKREIEYYE